MSTEDRDQVQDTTDRAQDATDTATTQDVSGGNGHDNLVDKAELEKQIQQRRKANKEAQEAKKRAEAAEARVAEFENAQKTEQEKLQAERDALAKRAETAERKAIETERTSAVVMAGAKGGTAARFVASELAAAESEDPDLDRGEWISKYKTANPEFFAGSQGRRAAEGGPGQPSPTARRDTLIKEHEEALKTERDPTEKAAHKRAIRILQAKASDADL